jgi:hypothetical protein
MPATVASVDDPAAASSPGGVEEEPPGDGVPRMPGPPGVAGAPAASSIVSTPLLVEVLEHAQGAMSKAKIDALFFICPGAASLDPRPRARENAIRGGRMRKNRTVRAQRSSSGQD